MQCLHARPCVDGDIGLDLSRYPRLFPVQRYAWPNGNLRGGVPTLCIQQTLFLFIGSLFDQFYLL